MSIKYTGNNTLSYFLNKIKTHIDEIKNKIPTKTSQLENDSNYATEEYVDASVTNLVNSAPETLDTLGELATAFEENAEVVEALNAAITNKADKTDIVQADWNENNESSAAYIQNKPFYETAPENVTIIDKELEFQYVSYFGAMGVQIPKSDLGAIPSATGKYTITIGETVYDNVEVLSNEYNIVIEILGDDGVPVVELNYPIEGEDYVVIMGTMGEDLSSFTDGATKTYHIIIKGIHQDVIAIDEKFLVNKPGLKTEGKTFTIDNETVIADIGAEIFNNYTANIATGKYSHAEGYCTIASGYCSHAEGNGTTASDSYAHAEGSSTKASGQYSHAEGSSTKAIGNISHAEGWGVRAVGGCSHAEGSGKIDYSINIDLNTANGTTYKITDTIAETMKDVLLYSYYVDGNGTEKISNVTISDGLITHITLPKVAPYKTLYFTIHGGSYGDTSHSEGYNSIAAGKYQHVQGKYNVIDSENKYAHIVGNGNYAERSNAHTLDWEGNAWFAGSVESTALILLSPNGTRFSITVGDDGVLSATEITA